MSSTGETEPGERFWSGSASNALGVVLAVLALGLGWIWIELVEATVANRSSVATGVAERFLHFLPWQLGLFLLLGIVVAAVTVPFGLARRSVGWVAVGLASWAFLASRVGEGVLRRGEAGMSSLPSAILASLLTAILIASLLWILSRLERWIPPAFRTIWPLGIWLFWSVFFLRSLARVGPSIAGWGGDPAAWLRELDAGTLITAIAAGGALVLLYAGIRRMRRDNAAVAAVLVATLLSAIVVAGILVPTPGRRPPAADSQTTGTNDVIVILVDTLRADHLGRRNGARSSTPSLDSLAAEGISFANAFSPGNNTRSAMPGVLTSLPWEAVGSPLPEEVDTLAELLEAEGFDTAGVSANPFISRRYGYEQGFRTFADPSDQHHFLVANLLQVMSTVFPGPAYGIGMARADLFYQPASSMMDDALRLLRGSAQPTFLYVQLMDPHGPYLPPKQYLPADFRVSDFVSYYEFTALANRNVLGSEEFRPRLLNLLQRYEAEVAFMDEQLGRFFDELRKMGRFDEALIWVLSDHGEAFGEEDWAGHNGKNMNNAVIQVPFIVKPPASWRIAARREVTPVSTSSLVPTTLSLLGRRIPQKLFGEDLSELIRLPGHETSSRVVISQGIRNTYAAVSWPWKLILTPEGHQIRERRLYHLIDDPHESRDLAEQFPDRVAELAQAIDDWKAESARGIKNEGGPEIDEATREQLRNLGYID